MNQQISALWQSKKKNFYFLSRKNTQMLFHVCQKSGYNTWMLCLVVGWLFLMQLRMYNFFLFIGREWAKYPFGLLYNFNKWSMCMYLITMFLNSFNINCFRAVNNIELCVRCRKCSKFIGFNKTMDFLIRRSFNRIKIVFPLLRLRRKLADEAFTVQNFAHYIRKMHLNNAQSGKKVCTLQMFAKRWSVRIDYISAENRKTTK